MTPALKTAVRAAGVEHTALTAALLFVAGENALANRDASGLLYAALAGCLVRADQTGDSLDNLLVGATTAASERRPDAVAATWVDLHSTDDVGGLAEALAGELALAALEGIRQTDVMAADLAALDNLDNLDGPSTA